MRFTFAKHTKKQVENTQLDISKVGRAVPQPAIHSAISKTLNPTKDVSELNLKFANLLILRLHIYGWQADLLFVNKESAFQKLGRNAGKVRHHSCPTPY